jgi:hypothetical protein
MIHLRKFGALVRVTVCALGLLAVPMAAVAVAQDRPAPTLELSGGWVGFADDGIVSEPVGGGAARLYLLPRISVGPEVVYIGGDNHSHLMVTANVTWDVLAPVNGRPRQVTPYFVTGGGIFQTRESFITGTFTSREGAFTAGGGIRGLVGQRMLVGVDARVGWELHLRLTGMIGLQLER